MTTNYPGSIDSLPRPTSTTAMNATGYEGDVVIDNISDAIEAIETELGTDPAGAQATVKARLEVADRFTAGVAAPIVWSSGTWTVVGLNSGSTSVSATLTANRVYYLPMFIPESVTLDRIGVNVSTGQTNASIRFGLYNASDTTLLPTGAASVDFGEVNFGTSTGQQLLTISTALTPGLKWFALHNEVDNAAIYASSWVSSRVVIHDGTAFPTGAAYVYQSATYASGLPTVASLTLDAFNVPTPGIMLRRT